MVMSNSLSYDQWLSLSEEERASVLASWNPYEGDGHQILEEACERFRLQVANHEGVQSVHCGLYHGGVYIIGVSVWKGARLRLPKQFEGFPVVKMVVAPGEA